MCAAIDCTSDHRCVAVRSSFNLTNSPPFYVVKAGLPTTQCLWLGSITETEEISHEKEAMPDEVVGLQARVEQLEQDLVAARQQVTGIAAWHGTDRVCRCLDHTVHHHNVS